MKSIHKLFILVTAVVVSLPSMVFAQFATPTEGFNNNGTRSAQFLKLAVGGRATAMGESYAAIANDASALFWNPGGVGNLQNFEAHLTHVEYLLDMTFDYIGIVIPTNAGNLGFSAGALGMGETHVTTLADPDGELGTTWSASSYALGITFARALSNRFSVGITGKYIRENIFNSSATSLALDIGSLYDTGISGIKIGMAMTNFGGKMQLSGRDFIVRDVDIEPTLGGNVTPTGELDRSEWPLPLMFRVGLSLEVMNSESGTLLIASDFSHPTDADERINVGAEYAFSNKIFLRGGYKFNYEEESVTFGGGLNLPITNYNLMIDYSYQEFGLLGETHRFSLGFRL